MALAPAQIGELPSRVGFGELFIAQVMDRGHGRAAVADGDDVGGGEEDIGRSPAEFAAEAQMRPQAALGDDDALDALRDGEQIGRGGLVEVEAKAMATFGSQRKERPDEVIGVILCAGAPAGCRTAGSNADDHKEHPQISQITQI